MRKKTSPNKSPANGWPVLQDWESSPRTMLIPFDRDESSEEVVIYCRLSHRATLAWFAMEYILGLDNVHIYDGSWTEWGSIVGFPIEK